MPITPVSEECQKLSTEIAAAMRALEVLAQKAKDLIEMDRTSIDNACELALSFHYAKATTKALYESVAAKTIDVMGNFPEHTLAGGIKVERRQGATRKKWDHLTLAKSVTEKLYQMAIDIDTGEMTMDNQQIAIKILEYVAPSYWRVKKLAEIGINADTYCEVSEGGLSLVISQAQGGTDDDEQ